MFFETQRSPGEEEQEREGGGGENSTLKKKKKQVGQTTVNLIFTIILIGPQLLCGICGCVRVHITGHKVFSSKCGILMCTKKS